MATPASDFDPAVRAFHELFEYRDADLAELVAIEARNKFHGEYVNHG